MHSTDNADKTERRLRALEDGYLTMEKDLLVMGRDMQGHLLACERRGARLERLAWGIATIVFVVLGMLIKAHFHLGDV